MGFLAAPVSTALRAAATVPRKMVDGAFYLAVGVSMVIWRKRLVRWITAWHTRFEGLRLMTEREPKTAERLMLVVGAVLVVLGLVDLSSALVLIAQR